jgi:hypothetical protein
MGLAQQFAKEELGEPLPVPQPVVPVVLRPSFIGVQDLVKVIDSPVSRQRHQLRSPRSDRHDTQDPLGVQGGHQQRCPAAARYPDDHGAVDVTGVHHRDDVGHELGVGVRRVRLRPVRPAVAPRIDGDDLEPAREVGHLGLPRARVHDRVNRGEHHRGPALAEHLIADLDAAAFHETLGVRIPGPHGTSLVLADAPSPSGFPCNVIAMPLQQPCRSWL